MEIELNVLEELANEYEIPLEKVKLYYNMLLEIPCVMSYDVDMLYECLVNIIQDVKTSEFVEEEKEKMGAFVGKEAKTLNYSISDALYRTYGDEAIPYLSEEYIEENKTRYSL